MKKFIIGLTTALLCCSLALSACTTKTPDDGGDDGEKDNGHDPVYALTLSEKELSLELTHSASLTATVSADGETIDAQVVWSSSNESVASVSDGVITANLTGTAEITATYNDLVQTCTVSVGASYLPSLELGVGDAALVSVLLEGGYQLEPYVLYDGVRFSDGSFAYTSDDSSVVSVSENGVLTGESVGTTDVTILGEWRGFGSDVLSAVYTVNVARDFSVSISTPEITTIASSDVILEGYDVPNTVRLSATVKENGQEISSPTLVWTSSDASVATVDNGLVTGVAPGTVSVSVSYTDESGALYVSVPVTITVEFPFVDKSETLFLGEVDASDAFDASASGLVISKALVFGESATEAITAVYDVTDGGSRAFTVTTDEDGNGVIRESGSNNFSAYDRVWEIHSATYAVRVSVSVVTRIIHNADDLMLCFNIVTTGSKNQTFYGAGAYYVLGGNIDASDCTRTEDSWTNDFKASGGSGFQGEFDGRGYTIDGITLQNGGLFGNLAAGSVIKNFALTNVTLTSARADYQPATLAYSVYGDAQIENVFIHVSSAVDKEYNATAGLRGLANLVRGSSSGTAPVFKNVVVYMDVGASSAAATATSLFTNYQSGNYAVMDNVHVISDYTYVCKANGGDTPTSATFSGIVRYGSGGTYASFASAYANVENVLATAGLSSDDWTYDANVGYPVFTSYYEGFLAASIRAAFDALPETLSFNEGEGGSYSVTSALGAVTVSLDGTNDENVTVSGGTLTVGASAASGSFNLVVTSLIDSSISKTVGVVVVSREEIAKNNAAEAFAELDGMEFEYSAGVAASWSVAEADLEALGSVTLSLPENAPAWASLASDETAVVISADAAAGSVTVTVTSTQYTDAAGDYFTAEITITVLNEEKTISEAVVLSVDEADEKTAVDYTSLEGFESSVGTSLAYSVDGTNWTAIAEGVTFEAGSATLTTSAISAIGVTGESVLRLRVQVPGATLVFTDVTVYTNIITTAEELLTVFAPNSASAVVDYGAGYYILGNNIDATGATQIVGHWNVADTKLGSGFVGVFDGKGYSIDGLTVQSGGLFGMVGTTAVIKNFALTNLILGGDKWQPVAIATNIYSGAVLDNIFIHVAEITTTAQSTGNVRAFANLVKGNYTNDQTTPAISNIVIVMNASTEDGVTTSSLLQKIELGSYAAFSNVHVISDSYLLTTTDTNTYFSGVTRYGANATNASFASAYADEEDVLAAVGLSADYWTYDAEIGYPVFTSYYNNFCE